MWGETQVQAVFRASFDAYLNSCLEALRTKNHERQHFSPTPAKSIRGSERR